MLIGADLEIKSLPDHGARVRLVLPHATLSASDDRADG
jgi:hypothetical protein